MRLGPKLLAWIVGMELGQLLQQLTGFFVTGIGRFNRHLHNLIPALVRPRIQNALFTQTEPLSVASALRDLQNRPAVDGRNFDLRAESGLPHCQRDFDFNIVPFAPKERMLRDARGDVEVSRGSALRAGVSLTGNAQT